jgi:hypothetical protein
MRRVVLTLALVFVIASVAQAADFCISVNGGAVIVVGKNFHVPAKNTCKPFSGFLKTGGATLLNGNACTASDGSLVLFNLVGDGLVSLQFSLPLPSLTGGTGGETVAIPTSTFSLDITADKVTCSPLVVPVP